MARRITKAVMQAAKTLGSMGGKKGGPARAAALSSSQKSKIARQGGLASHQASKIKNKYKGD